MGKTLYLDGGKACIWNLRRPYSRLLDWCAWVVWKGHELPGFVRKAVLTGSKRHMGLACLVVVFMRVIAKLGPKE